MYPKIIHRAIEQGYLSEDQAREYLQQWEQQPSVPIERWLMRHRYLSWEQLKNLISDTTFHQQDTGLPTPEKPSQASQVLSPGTCLGPYTVVRLLGKGGMGNVYLARQSGLLRPVALKMMNGLASGNQRQVQRFLREIKLSACLVHPNIVKTYTAGIDNNVPYFAMNYLQGQSLDLYLGSDNLPLSGKLALIGTIARALYYAHQQGIVHRDVKPSNILITSEGVPMLMDFGVAKSNRVYDKSLTITGEVVGTPKYMSPEQARGEKKIDGRSDIYSLGNILYEITTGQPMFSGNVILQLLEQIGSGVIELPGRVNPDLPKEVEAIILKSVAHDKNKRYQDAEKMANDIDRYLAGGSVHALKEYRMIKLRRILFIRRHGLIYGTLVIMILLVTTWWTCLPAGTKPPARVRLANSLLDRMEQLGLRLQQQPQLTLYSEFIKLAQDNGYYTSAIEKCRQAISWAQKHKPDAVFMLQKKQLALLMQCGEYHASCRLFLSLPKPKREPKLALALAILAFQLKEYARVLKILEAASSEVTGVQGFFYQGAARFKIFHGQVARYRYLDRVASGAFEQNQQLKQVTTWLTKAMEVAEHRSSLASRICCYLACCRLLRREWPAVQGLVGVVGLSDALTKDEQLLWRETLGILAYCQGHYSQAVEHFSCCIEIAPWKSCYYIFRLQNHGKQSGNFYDQMLDDCFRSLKLFPSNLEPIGLVASDVLQSRRYDEYYTIKLFSGFFKKSLTNVDPNILAPEYHETAARYLHEFSGVGHGITNALIAKIDKARTPSALEAIGEILCELPDKQYVLNCLEKTRQRYSSSTVNKSIGNILRQVEAKYHAQKLQTWLARLMAGHDTTVISQMATPRYAGELIKILQQEKLPVLLRYWAAESLLASQILANYQLLQDQTREAKPLSRLLALTTLARAGFEIDPRLLPAGLNKMPELAIVIAGHHLAAYFPFRYYLPLLQSTNEKIRAVAGRALWLQGKEQGIAPLVACFKSDKEEVRAYACWWFWDILRQKPLGLQRRAFNSQYLRQLQTCLVNDPSVQVRRVAAATIGRLNQSNLHPDLQRRLTGLTAVTSKALVIEKDKTVRLQILMALIKQGELSLVVRHSLNPQEEFDNRIAPWIRMFGDQTILSRALTKNNYTALRFCMDDQIRKRLLSGSDPRFSMLYLMLIGVLGKDPGMPLFLKKRLVIAPIKQALRSPDKTIRAMAARAAIVVDDRLGILRRILRRQYSKEKDSRVKHNIISTIFYYLESDRETSYSFDLPTPVTQCHPWMRKLVNENPQATLQGCYRFLEDYYFEYVDTRPFQATTLWERDQHYWRHLDTLVNNICLRSYNIVSKLQMRVLPWIRDLQKEIVAQKYANLLVMVRQGAELFPLGQQLSARNRIILWRLFCAMETFRIERYLRQSCRLAPDQARYLFETYFLLETLGEWEMAYSYLQQAIECQPQRLMFQLAKARLFFKWGKLPQAREQIEIVLAKNLRSEMLCFLAGRIYLAMQQWQQAEQSFTSQHIIVPHLPEPLVFRSYSRIWQNRIAAANQDLANAYKRIKAERQWMDSYYEQDAPDRQLAELYLYRTEGFYYFGLARLAARASNHRTAIDNLRKSHQAFLNSAAGYYESPLTQSNLRRYPEFAGLLHHPFVRELPGELVGFSEIK